MPSSRGARRSASRKRWQRYRQAVSRFLERRLLRPVSLSTLGRSQISSPAATLGWELMILSRCTPRSTKARTNSRPFLWSISAAPESKSVPPARWRSLGLGLRQAAPRRAYPPALQRLRASWFAARRRFGFSLNTNESDVGHVSHLAGADVFLCRHTLRRYQRKRGWRLGAAVSVRRPSGVVGRRIRTVVQNLPHTRRVPDGIYRIHRNIQAVSRGNWRIVDRRPNFFFRVRDCDVVEHHISRRGLGARQHVFSCPPNLSLAVKSDRNAWSRKQRGFQLPRCVWLGDWHTGGNACGGHCRHDRRRLCAREFRDCPDRREAGGASRWTSSSFPRTRNRLWAPTE